ncbi:hypothetical protein [Brucella pseudogrignonensis]|uniref:hypothetical protein n=1 Tax=Brucella pseudogrignonensis TaxID=419475 RepID=UPI00124C8327|nr:hypothetical protein [Brucella pseudogrignonensis]KAB2686787.1 hypothetical protein F9K82_18450 [Brucella pseudogrignonensis]
MNRDIPIGALSIRQENYLDETLLRESYDLVISVIGWETRGLSCLPSLVNRSEDIFLLHFESVGEFMCDEKSKNMEKIDRLLNNSQKIELKVSTNFSDNTELIQDAIHGVYKKKSRALNVLIDITCMPKRYILFILGLGFRRELFSSIDILYAEAEKYELTSSAVGTERPQIGLVSQGNWTSEQIPYLEAENYVPDKRDLFISVGAEITEATPIVNRFEPNNLTLFHIDQGNLRLPNSLMDKERPALDQLLAYSGVKEERFKLNDVAGVALSILQQSKCGTTCLAIGPKTHAVAFALAALANRNIEVVCRSPEKYIVNDVKPSGVRYFYRIQDRFDPLSYM